MTGLSSSELCIWLHTSPIPISHILQSLLCSPVPLFLCSSVLLLLRFYVSLFTCAPYFTSFMSRVVFPFTFCVSHFPLSVASFLSYFFPLFPHFFATLFFPSILFLCPSNFYSPTQKRWETNANEQT